MMTRLVIPLVAGVLFPVPAASVPTPPAVPPSDAVSWRFEHDGAGRPVKIIDPAGKTTSFAYHLGEGQRVQQVTKQLPDGSRVVFSFDHLARLASMTDAAATLRYEYDTASRLTAVRRDGVPPISYQYDTLDRLSVVNLGTDLSTRYTYDFSGRVARIDTPAGPISYEYRDGQAQVMRSLPNGIRTVWESHPDGSLKSISHMAKDNTILSQFAYSYRADGLVGQVRERSPQGERVLNHEFNKAGRLTGVADSSIGTINYQYDKLGNLTELRAPGQPVMNNVTDWSGRVVKHAEQAVLHDPAGNLTAYTRESGKVSLGYTPNHLLSVIQTPTDKIRLQYDGLGNLIGRTFGAGRTTYVPDPLSASGRPLLAVNPGGQRTLYVWEGPTPVAAITGKQTEFYLHDRFGSVRAVADRGGQIIQHVDYSPLGTPRSTAPLSAADPGLRPGFGGLFYEPKASVYLTPAGAYDPHLGRVLQNDFLHHVPIAPPPGLETRPMGLPLTVTRPASLDRQSLTAALQEPALNLRPEQVKSVVDALVTKPLTQPLSPSAIGQRLRAPELKLIPHQQERIAEVVVPKLLPQATLPGGTERSIDLTSLSKLIRNAPGLSPVQTEALAGRLESTVRQQPLNLSSVEPLVRNAGHTVGLPPSATAQLSSDVMNALQARMPDRTFVLQSAGRAAEQIGLPPAQRSELSIRLSGLLNNPPISAPRAQLLLDRVGGDLGVPRQDLQLLQQKLSRGPEVIDFAALRANIANAPEIATQSRGRLIDAISTRLQTEPVELSYVPPLLVQSGQAAGLSADRIGGLRDVVESMLVARISGSADLMATVKTAAPRLNLPAVQEQRLAGYVEERLANPMLDAGRAQALVHGAARELNIPETSMPTLPAAAGDPFTLDRGLVTVVPGVNDLWSGAMLDSTRDLSPSAQVFVITPKTVGNPADPNQITLIRVDNLQPSTNERTRMFYFGHLPAGERVPLSRLPENAIVVIDMELGWLPGALVPGALRTLVDPDRKWGGQTQWAGRVSATVENSFRSRSSDPVIAIGHSAGTEAHLFSLDHGARPDQLILASPRRGPDDLAHAVTRNGMAGRILVQEAFNDLWRVFLQPVTTTGFDVLKGYHDPRYVGVFDVLKVGRTEGTRIPILGSLAAHGIGFSDRPAPLRFNTAEIVAAAPWDFARAWVAQRLFGLDSGGEVTGGAVGGGGWRPPDAFAFPRRDDSLGALPNPISERIFPSYIEPFDRPLNWLGNITGSNWIGRNRSGAEPFYAKDRLGQFPLGVTTTPARFYGDRIARSHDIQYWINTHVPKGVKVSVPAPHGRGVEYYTSQGPGGVGFWGSANWAAVRDVGLGLLSYALPAGELLREHVWTANWGRPTPRGAAIPLAQFTSRDPADYQLRPAYFPPGAELGVGRHEVHLDDQRRPAFFPPGGGGGGAAPTFGLGAAGPLSPSNVGGIYLQGVGEAFKSLGPLKGIAVDEKTGRITLLSDTDGAIGLPPLRLDDVVTVFRSVYGYGEAPFVSIDPDPKSPEGPIMLVRHGSATPDTYVGWVLFEADRVMKGYSLGHDNITRQPIKSGIASYQNILALGFSSVSGGHNAPIWERFWIVPAEVNRKQAKKRELTLFDVPLKVNTQRMQLQNGKLVPASNPTPSASAKAFSEWFTENYHAIAAEIGSLPKGCGFDSPVAFFTELQRIAVIAALAESLRDQGVPMPAWMRDYQVQPCPIDPTTPAITVEASQTKTAGNVRTTQTQHIYGGVNLSPADENVHTTVAAPEANALAPVVSEAVAAAPLLTPVNIEKDGKQYHAVALPGNDTGDVGASRLAETDLTVPVQQGTEISLTRYFHSFFELSGSLGDAWTFDLPRLEEQRRPIRHTEDKVEFKIGYQLTSPLNTYSETFTEKKPVPEVQADLLVPDRPGEVLGVANVEDEKIGMPTRVVLFRDGRQWHFDEAGNLAAMEELPLTVVYRRDQGHRLKRIEGWYGKDLRADIQLEYDARGRLISARGSNGESVTYGYDEAGTLSRVAGPAGVAEYRYDKGLVTAVVRDGVVLRHFEYADRGRLRREQRADGTDITYSSTASSNGVQVKAAGTDTAKVQESVQYDQTLRPVNRVLDDGTQVQWQYGEKGAVSAKLVSADGKQTEMSRTPDGKRETWKLPEGARYAVENDEGGRLTSLREGDREVVHQKWHPDGRLASQTYETVAVHPEYREDGVMTGVLLSPPEEGPQFSRWANVQLDELGRPAAIKDFSGSEVKVGYDKTGEPAIVASKLGGVEVQRDDRGRVQTVRTSWGDQERYAYDTNGSPQKVEATRGSATSIVEFAQGRPVKARGFDGGETSFAYYDDPLHAGRIKEVRGPEDQTLRYEYDSRNRPGAADYAGSYRVEYAYDAQGRLTGVSQLPAAPGK